MLSLWCVLVVGGSWHLRKTSFCFVVVVFVLCGVGSGLFQVGVVVAVWSFIVGVSLHFRFFVFCNIVGCGLCVVLLFLSGVG